MTKQAIEIGLHAVIVAMIGNEPCILRVPGSSSADALPSGPFDPLQHRTMEIGLRQWVEEQTALRLGYVEQLYTFGDRGRQRTPGDSGPHFVSVGYLALTRVQPEQMPALRRAGGEFGSWYDFLPWEDWRAGRPAMLDEFVLPAIRQWAARVDRSAYASRGLQPSARVRIAFGTDGSHWDEEHVLDRYELMYSAGLVAESVRDGRYDAIRAAGPTGTAMEHDHRRILATAMSRLRAKLKYRPVIFELLPEEFTLTELQQTVESIFGRPVHKQNFRRLVEKAQLVEPTGASSNATGGRPAALFRFRREVLEERPAPGLRVGRRA
ncbi:MAG: NAD regulator [Alphaproteobacteria bacterium]|nr:MAG: NAD regulator [Alphaproteobacteria bacterium]